MKLGQKSVKILVGFLGDLKTPQFHSEINWALAKPKKPSILIYWMVEQKVKHGINAWNRGHRGRCRLQRELTTKNIYFFPTHCHPSVRQNKSFYHFQGSDLCYFDLIEHIHFWKSENRTTIFEKVKIPTCIFDFKTLGDIIFWWAKNTEKEVFLSITRTWQLFNILLGIFLTWYGHSFHITVIQLYARKKVDGWEL